MSNTVNLTLPGISQFTGVSSWNATRLIGAGINLILIVAGLIFFLLLLVGGFQYILSGGSSDKQGSQRAQKAISGALIGFLIVFGIYALMLLLSSFFGLNLLLFTIINV